MFVYFNWNCQSIIFFILLHISEHQKKTNYLLNIRTKIVVYFNADFHEKLTSLLYHWATDMWVNVFCFLTMFGSRTNTFEIIYDFITDVKTQIQKYLIPIRTKNTFLFSLWHFSFLIFFILFFSFGIFCILCLYVCVLASVLKCAQFVYLRYIQTKRE